MPVTFHNHPLPHCDSRLSLASKRPIGPWAVRGHGGRIETVKVKRFCCNKKEKGQGPARIPRDWGPLSAALDIPSGVAARRQRCCTLCHAGGSNTPTARSGTVQS